jgi:ADP-ribosylglycohydrolase
MIKSIARSPRDEKRAEAILGLLIGCAVGDSIGLPAEGMSKTRIRRRWKGVWKQRLLFGHGLISDDTEHTWQVAECLLQSRGDVEKFRPLLAWKLRLWFAALPPGIGLATARACLKLWIGIPPDRSGVRSAGNGPAMRSAVIGAVHCERPDLLESFVIASTRITHTDPRAATGALAVARCAAWIARHSGETTIDREEILRTLRTCGADDEWQALVGTMETALAAAEGVEALAARIGCDQGVSGFVYRTVPVAIYAWLRHDTDFRAGIEAVCNCGGDTDTVAALAGSLLGARSGVEAMPREWRDRLLLWPGSTARSASLAEALTQTRPASVRCYSWGALLSKNLLMFVVVLVHGFRRLLWPC